MIFVLLFLLTSCGQEKPPVNTDPPITDNTVDNQPTDNQPFTDNIPENNGNSKPLDYSPCEGVHIKAEANAFWEDTDINFKPIDESTENIREIDQKLYDEEGILMVAGFEIDAGLADDEYMPGQFDVEFDLSTTEIDPDYYEYLKIYRVGDNGEYHELNANVENGILKFSSDHNSAFIVCFLIEAAIGAAILSYGQTLEGNAYFMKSADETLVHEGKNIFASWQIEWIGTDIDPDFYDKLKKMAQIEHKYIREAEKKYREDEMYFATNQMLLNEMMFDYIIKSVEKDEEHNRLKNQITFPETIKEIDKCVDNAFRYLYQEEKMRMPVYRVPLKLIKSDDPYYGIAVNKGLSKPYVDINMKKVNPETKEDMYNLQMTLAHELLHICQIRYRLPVDIISDNTRYDEMVAQMMEADALAYFQRKDIIPESANLDLTRYDYWGNLRLPINGEEDSNLSDNKRQDEIINCGYNLGSLLRFIIDKTGKRPWAHTIMKARSYWTSGGISGPLCDVFEIDERTFDMYFRNWVITNRNTITKLAPSYVMGKMYGLEGSTIMKKGEKYHKDFIHSASYFLNLRNFEISKEEKDVKVILAPDKELMEVFSSINLGSGLEHKSITAGQFYDKLFNYTNTLPNLMLPVLELQGDASQNDTSRNAGYTVYVLDKTPKAELELTDEKLIIRLPEPNVVEKDGIADGYILKITTDKGKTIEKDIPKEYFGKDLQLDRSVLYEENEPSEELKLKATLTEFFLDSNQNKILGIPSDDAELLADDDSFVVKVTKNGNTITIKVDGAVVYGEDNTFGSILCQAVPFSKINITVTSADGAQTYISTFHDELGGLYESGSTNCITMGATDIGTWVEFQHNGVWYLYLKFIPVDAYTETNLRTFEPSWSETKNN